MKPFYKSLKVKDKIIVKETGETGEVIKLLPNHYLQLPWLYPNYLVQLKTEQDIFRRNELKLLNDNN